jgi:hypothetical protein
VELNLDMQNTSQKLETGDDLESSKTSFFNFKRRPGRRYLSSLAVNKKFAPKRSRFSSQDLNNKKSIPAQNLNSSRVSRNSSSYQKPKATSRYAQLNQPNKNVKSRIGSFRPSVMAKHVSSNYISKYKYTGSNSSGKDASSKHISAPLNLSQSSRRSQSMKRGSYLTPTMSSQPGKKAQMSGFNKSSERKHTFKPRMSRYMQDGGRKKATSTSLPQGAFKSTLHKNLTHNKNLKSQET